jgi:hypothetical protein
LQVSQKQIVTGIGFRYGVATGGSLKENNSGAQGRSTESGRAEGRRCQFPRQLRGRSSRRNSVDDKSILGAGADKIITEIPIAAVSPSRMPTVLDDKILVGTVITNNEHGVSGGADWLAVRVEHRIQNSIVILVVPRGVTTKDNVVALK